MTARRSLTTLVVPRTSQACHTAPPLTCRHQIGGRAGATCVCVKKGVEGKKGGATVSQALLASAAASAPAAGPAAPPVRAPEVHVVAQAEEAAAGANAAGAADGARAVARAPSTKNAQRVPSASLSAHLPPRRPAPAPRSRPRRAPHQMLRVEGREEKGGVSCARHGAPPQAGAVAANKTMASDAPRTLLPARMPALTHRWWATPARGPGHHGRALQLGGTRLLGRLKGLRLFFLKACGARPLESPLGSGLTARWRGGRARLVGGGEEGRRMGEPLRS